ncbi:AAA-ATPase ASD, mitochondrial [Dichanthelium oligosanthes]|uniref:AAA-ATPase ASD, mitochondrial n=1 Tax=Dichanthelium oligosanthes TaxID=888268 RepID=A0A1E5VJN2_9POAL|nr:AAA-ATPase ASD, mitochondrial [Dichanthelium oligosanthes]
MKAAMSWSSLGSFLATAMVVRAAVRDVLPPEAHWALRALLARAVAAFSQPTDTIVVHEADANGVPNELYDAAQLYLGARCLASAPALHLHKAHGAPEAVASLPGDHAARDTFRGVTVAWTSSQPAEAAYSGVAYSPFGGGPRGGLRAPPGGSGRQQPCLRLEFQRRDRDVVRGEYIPHVLAVAAVLRLKMRERKLYTNNPNMYGGGGGMDDHQMLWSSRPFVHPSTFDSLAIDPALRDSIRADLLRFVRRREHYARAGRSWKRGYLLHGPPGTGKTSLVAAIANLLEFDIYDLELTAVGSNSDLRRLLASTRPKSLIVVEDIDCSLGLFDRTRTSSSPSQDAESDDPGSPHHVNMSPYGPPRSREKISLSGVLNFVDGLWSSCVGERLIVFTTNHVDRLDPALLRPGRMDRKIELGYCNGHALRVLAKNYLGDCGTAVEGDDGHEPADDGRYEELIGEAERLLEEVHLTPADVAEVFMRCEGDGSHAALQKLVDDLHSKRIAQQCVVSNDV